MPTPTQSEIAEEYKRKSAEALREFDGQIDELASKVRVALEEQKQAKLAKIKSSIK